ncbi:hypothetical protein CPARA_1gp012 (nucleomorph) [Cryptomonas paramecium]|uniref:Uncharacterized protein n=1 Tax=Cryptomonas paramaecium TaxID=2898 RepID=F2HH74_9CRYP|nr:hypothetical protein CPARA_1gp012 [Cryptomonas paramecium]AEA38670.1 hypothetical protein CPARA_1gp012 [Cryptomonas paramecium]
MVIQKRKILKISNKTTLEKAYFLKKKLSIYTKFFFDNYTNSMQHVVKFLFKWNLIKLKIGKMNSFVYNPIVHFKKAKKFFLHKTLLNSSYEIFLEHILVSGFCFPKKKKTKICKKRVLFYTINNMFRIKNLTFYTNIFLDMSVLNILFNIDRKFFDSNDIDKKCFFCNLQKHKPKIMKKKEKISLKFYFGIFLYKTIKIENLFLSLILEIIYLQKKHLNNILEWIFYIKFNFDITLCCFSNFLLQ